MRRLMTPVCGAMAVALLFAAPAASQTSSTERIPGAATVTTEKMTGEVVKVEGNTLVVKMANGELRTFNNIPDSRKATVDGKQIGVRELEPGTRLTATITKTTTPVTVRTTTVGSGKVWYVAPPNVILTLPNGENKQFKVKNDYKFNVNGQPATVFDLRPGMTVSAEKIVEEPTVDIATNSTVVGRTRTALAAAPAAGAPAAAPAAAAPEAPAKLPKTGSQLPMLGFLGLLLIGASMGLRFVKS